MFAFFVALLVAMAMIPGSFSGQSPNSSLATRGNGELLVHCDDNWTILPKQYFVGNCDNGKSSRDFMSIDLSNCFTVTDQGTIAMDNYHVCVLNPSTRRTRLTISQWWLWRKVRSLCPLHRSWPGCLPDVPMQSHGPVARPQLDQD
jgi:hypothetical protein